MAKVPAKKAPKRKANGYKLPEPIPLNEVLTDLVKKKWIIGPSIGVGGFGEIYSAAEYTGTPSKTKQYPYVIKIEPHENGPLFVERSFYLTNAKQEDIESWTKSKKLSILGMPRYIGSGSHECNNQKYRFLVMERFGKDLWSIFIENNCAFPSTTVFQIGIQIINVLEYIHNKGYVHADIKGANILLGLGKKLQNQVFLVDFGLASKYSTSSFKDDPKKAHNGTIEYTSRDAHCGIITRRGDLEILAYNMLQWLGYKLPWEKSTDVNVVQKEKIKFMTNVSKTLKSKYDNIPAALVQFFGLIAEMDYGTGPNYEKYKSVFLDAIKQNGDTYNGPLIFSSSSITKKVTKRVKSVKNVTPSPPKRTRRALLTSPELFSDEEDAHLSSSLENIEIQKKKEIKKRTVRSKKNNDSDDEPVVKTTPRKSKKSQSDQSDEKTTPAKRSNAKTKAKTESSWKNCPTVKNSKVLRPGEYKNGK